MTCEVCGYTNKNADTHRCRFERACSCWYGQPCDVRYTTSRLGREQRFLTLADAKRYADKVFERTGAILGIQQIKLYQRS